MDCFASRAAKTGTHLELESKLSACPAFTDRGELYSSREPVSIF